MESSDSLVSATASLPPTICENPDYLPPALPPKRHRTNNKLNSLNTPPSSPKLALTESLGKSINDLSSQSLNNNNNLLIDNKSPITPTSPSSNYVQISSKTIAAAAAAAQPNDFPNINSKIVVPSIPPPTAPSTVLKGNDVRAIYSNVNNINATNKRSNDENHYIQLYDDSVGDHKLNANSTNVCKTSNQSCDDERHQNTQTCNSKIINNNNTLSESNDTADDDDEDIVVLRHPQPTSKPSSNSNSKVLYFFN